MAEAHAEHGQLAAQRGNGLDHFRHIGGVAGAVGDVQAIRLAGKNFFGGGVVGHHGHIAANAVERLDQALLDAAVDGHHAVARIGSAGIVLLFAAYAAHAVGGCHIGLDACHGLLMGHVRIADQGSHAAFIADDAGDGAGIHLAQAGHIAFLQQLRKRFGIAEVGGLVAVFTNHHAAQGGHAGFAVLIVDAVVADEGVGHQHHLVGIAGIGHDLLIAHHRGIEHQLAQRIRFRAEADAHELSAVCQHQLALFHYFFCHTASPPTLV